MEGSQHIQHYQLTWKSTHSALPTYISRPRSTKLHQYSVLSTVHQQQLMCLFFSGWTEPAVCRHKTIPLYMAADHLVHSANHMYHLIYIQGY